MEYTENHYKGMRTKVIIFIIITLFSMIRAFCKDYSDVLQSGFKQEIYSENFLKALGADSLVRCFGF